jgi:hypothetical protein
MVFIVGLWPTTKSTGTKNTCQTLAILMAMRIHWCDAGRIAQCSASVASCEATRCHHWASACAVLPWQLPWLTISKKNKNTNKTQLLPSVLMVDQCKKLSNLETRQEPSTHILGKTSHDPNPYAISQVEELSYILSYQT